MSEHATPESVWPDRSKSTQWTVDQAETWNAAQPWVVGCNFLPSTAINQLEMWQEESFDTATIDRELGWAASIGMNAVRVYLHDLAYEVDPQGFLGRVGEFLSIADRHGIRALIVFFDDCWNPDPVLGPQPAPRPGIHNSGWVNSPGKSQRTWPADLARLEVYVKAVLTAFKDDPRVYLWDLYNEPGGGGYDKGSLELVRHVFDWAWAIRPSQPLSVGIWQPDEEFRAVQAENSDVVTFHNYEGVEKLTELIAGLRTYGRPLVCTEWMARTNDSLVVSHLPIFHREKIACFNWGLVSGKSNTIFPWGSPLDAPEPETWFHDLFRADGRPFDENEILVFRETSGRGTAV